MGRSKELNEKMKQEMKMKIINTAISYFAVNGLNGTKISDIAKKANISQGLLYHYFSSKEELYKEVCELILTSKNHFFELIKEKNLAPVEELKELTNLLGYALMDKEKHLKESFILMCLVQKELGYTFEVKNWEDYPVKFVMDIIIKGQKANTFKKGDPEELSRLYWGAVYGVCFVTLNNDNYFNKLGFKNLNNLLLV